MARKERRKESQNFIDYRNMMKTETEERTDRN